MLLILPLFGYAQRDSIRATIRDRYFPTGLRIGTDAISLARNFYDDSFKGWEVNADVDINRYFFTIDYGKWGRSYPGDSIQYSNEGRYWRVGADVNFLTQDPERNMFFVGMRYGRGVFDETFFTIDTDELWGVKEATYFNNSVSARWFELTTGIKVKMFDWFWMGYTARFKFGLKTEDTPVLIPHDVPGYGRTDRESYWGFNYQLMFRIPYRPYPSLPPKKKK